MNFLITLIIQPIAKMIANGAFKLIQHLIEEYKKDKQLKEKFKEISHEDNAQTRAKRIDDVFNSEL